MVIISAIHTINIIYKNDICRVIIPFKSVFIFIKVYTSNSIFTFIIYYIYIKTCFPNAPIVIDSFHIVQRLCEALDEMRLRFKRLQLV